MRSDFCAFILSHGRADNVVTYKKLKDHGYTGPIYILIDNEDKTADEYYKRYGDKVIMFDKEEVGKTFDRADNFGNKKVIVYARNACYGKAKELGYKYFIELDDDYHSFSYRSAERSYKITNLDTIFTYMVEFLSSSDKIKTVAMSQGGDHIGGFDDSINIKRKAMNSFVCDIDKRIIFKGSINEDVNCYTHDATKGDLFFTIWNIQLNQVQTQTSSGGMTDSYKNLGTYIKSFYSILFCPSCVSINLMGNKDMRMHHKIKWANTIPKIIEEKHKKEIQKLNDFEIEETDVIHVEEEREQFI